MSSARDWESTPSRRSGYSRRRSLSSRLAASCVELDEWQPQSGSVRSVQCCCKQLYDPPRTAHISHHFLSDNLVDEHVPAHRDPAPAEPSHLALVRHGHGRSCAPVIRRSTHSYDRARALARALPPEQRPDQGRRRVQHTHIFARQAHAGERVQGHGAFPAPLSVHERLDKGDRARAARDVVRVRRHAARVEGDEGVDVGGWRHGRGRARGRGRERRGEQVGQ